MVNSPYTEWKNYVRSAIRYSGAWTFRRGSRGPSAAAAKLGPVVGLSLTRRVFSLRAGILE